MDNELDADEAPLVQENEHIEPPSNGHDVRRTLLKLYLSHTLSAWSSRTFEFGAVLFLAAIFPGTLLYASSYALIRAASAIVFSPLIGHYVDGNNRLKVIRLAITWQRISVAVSCLLFILMIEHEKESSLVHAAFFITAAFACVEKLGAVGSTVALERDWVVVITEELRVDRQDVNTMMRRIDLLCKLLAPLFVSFMDANGTKMAIWVVFGFSSASIVIEYVAIAQVYQEVAALGMAKDTPEPREDELELQDQAVEDSSCSFAQPRTFVRLITRILVPWRVYMRNSVFLASFSLNLLYLTVLSTGVQFTTYLLAVGFTSLDVSFVRTAAVIFELLGTVTAPFITNKIGPIRSGLWFINWQLATLIVGVSLFVWTNGDWTGSISLISGVILSRLGLWGFDLSVQFLIQEVRFATSEML